MLVEAASKGDEAMVRILLVKGADPFVTDDEGRDSFFYADLGGVGEGIDLMRDYRRQRDPPTAGASLSVAGNVARRFPWRRIWTTPYSKPRYIHSGLSVLFVFVFHLLCR